MKKNLILIFILTFLISFCSKKAIDFNEFNNLISNMNNNSNAIEFKIDKENTSIKELDSVNSEIIVKKPVLILDTSGFSKFNPLYKPMKINMNFDSVKFTYNNDTKEMFLNELIGLNLHFNIFDLINFNYKEKENDLLKFQYDININKVNLNNYNITPLFNEDSKDLIETLINLFDKNKKYKQNIKNMKLTFDLKIKDEKSDYTIKSDINIKDIEAINSINPLLLKLFTYKNLEELKKELKTSESLFNENNKLNGISINLTLKNKDIFEAIIKNFETKSFLQKEGSKNNFTIDLNLNGFELTSNNDAFPENIRNLLKLNNYHFRFTFKNLSDDIVLEYFNMIKMQREFTKNKKNKNNQMNQYGLKLMGLFTQSKPIIELDLSIDHPIGKISMKSHFQFTGGIMPQGFAEVYIPRYEELLNVLKQIKILKDKDLNDTYTLFNKYFITDNLGNAKLRFEIKNNQTFLNGKSLK